MNPYPKTKPWRSPKYLAYIRKQPCIITGQLAEPHHVKTNSNHGMGRKPSDYWSLPVNREKHDEWEKETNRYMEEKYSFYIYKKLFKMVTGYLRENQK